MAERKKWNTRNVSCLNKFYNAYYLLLPLIIRLIVSSILQNKKTAYLFLTLNKKSNTLLSPYINIGVFWPLVNRTSIEMEQLLKV